MADRNPPQRGHEPTGVGVGRKRLNVESRATRHHLIAAIGESLQLLVDIGCNALPLAPLAITQGLTSVGIPTVRPSASAPSVGVLPTTLTILFRGPQFVESARKKTSCSRQNTRSQNTRLPE